MKSSLCSADWSILDHSPEGHLIFTTDLEVVFWNRNMETWSGIPRLDAIGQRLSDIYERVGTPKYASRMAAVLAGGPPVIFSSQLHQYVLPLPVAGGSGEIRIQHTIVSRLPHSLPLAIVSIQDVTTVTKALEQHRESLVQLTDEIEERKQVEETLSQERKFLQAIVNGIPDPIKVIDTEYRILLVNSEAQKQIPLGATHDYCYEVNHHINYPCKDKDGCCPVREVQATGQSVEIVREHYVSDSDKRFFDIKASPLVSKDGDVWAIVEAGRDITQRLAMEKQLLENEVRLHDLAHHDSLTGLPNRLLLLDRMNQAMGKAIRDHSKVAVLFLDLDRFKNVNDSLGHDIGDELLKTVSARLIGCVRETDTVARLGGDEFVILLEGLQDCHDISGVCAKVFNVLARSMTLGDVDLTISTSMGIGVFPDDGQDVDGLLKCADTAMYLAKKKGRNNYQFFEQSMHAEAIEKLLLENSLRHAIENDELVVYYQPKVKMATGEIIGAEALVRWVHPVQGLISPASFIPVAEESGLIEELGKMVMQTSCLQNKKWQDMGFAPLTVSVNLSIRQFRQESLLDDIANALAGSKLDPQYLEVEITESCMAEDIDGTIRVLQSLQDLQVQIAIDDFGTGYSSLAYLTKFPIHVLKIDQSFVRDIEVDGDNVAIVTAVIQLARALGLEVIAEGVETQKQQDVLLEKGCTLAQGYLYGRPVPADEFEEFLYESGHSGFGS